VSNSGFHSAEWDQSGINHAVQDITSVDERFECIFRERSETGDGFLEGSVAGYQNDVCVGDELLERDGERIITR
jgi:hypothetical protein